MDEGTRQLFTKEDLQMASKGLKRCSASLLMGETPLPAHWDSPDGKNRSTQVLLRPRRDWNPPWCQWEGDMGGRSENSSSVLRRETQSHRRTSEPIPRHGGDPPTAVGWCADPLADTAPPWEGSRTKPARRVTAFTCGAQQWQTQTGIPRDARGGGRGQVGRWPTGTGLLCGGGNVPELGSGDVVPHREWF